MRVLITCGPSFTPIDQVRRLTNASTGSLGVLLAERLARAGWEVVCLKGSGAVHPNPPAPVRVETFTTNEDLETRLTAHAQGAVFQAVLHAAALVDFQATRIEDASGSTRSEGKIPSGVGALVVRLTQAPKVIARLRALFPTSWIAGWKYEVEGSVESALQRGWQQMQAHRTNACVVNGPVVGSGFRICLASNRVEDCPDRIALAEWLVRMLDRM